MGFSSLRCFIASGLRVGNFIYWTVGISVSVFLFFCFLAIKMGSPATSPSLNPIAPTVSSKTDYNQVDRNKKTVADKPVELIIEKVVVSKAATPLGVTMSSLKLKTPQFKRYYSSNVKNPTLSPEMFSEIENHHGLPIGLLYYQMIKESEGTCPIAPNRSGALGCFQFLSETAEDFDLISGGVDLRSNMFASADASARYLRWLMTLMFGDNADQSDWEQLKYALAAFNAGHGKVRIRGVLKIPAFSETLSYVHEIESLTKGKSIIIRRGDTLTKISERTGVPVVAILSGNPDIISNQTLFAGSLLALPDPVTGMSEFLVTHGEDLSSVQKGTGLPLSILQSANNLPANAELYVGDVLNIPTGYLVEPSAL